MKKTRSMRWRMFISFMTVLLAVIAVFLVLDAVRTYRAMREELVNSMDQLALNVAGQLDGEVRQLSLMTERIVFSAQLREAIINQLPQSDGVERYRQFNRLNDLMYSICGPKPTFYHANIVSADGHQYAFGQEFKYAPLPLPVSELGWYDQAVERDGKLLIVPLHKSASNQIEQDVISVCRGFGILLGLPVRAVVEMQRDYDYLAAMIERAAFHDLRERERRTVCVLDAQGSLIYPRGLSDAEIAHYAALLGQPDALARHDATLNPVTQRCELAFGAQGEFSGWRVLVAPNESVLLDPMRALVLQTLLASVLLLSAAAVVSMLLSRRFSIPIQRLCAYVDNLRLDRLGEEGNWSMESRVDELEQLGGAFNQMTRRLHSSLDQVVELKNVEMHARMLALQAQMNPHFLYNTLAVIQIMVEDGETGNVQWACKNLSNMLEYISTRDLSSVTIKEELQHTLNYIDLILIRYPGDIEFSVDMPGDMLDVRVPKLVIQPLVENAIKYVAERPPVWHVRLSAYVEADHWFVRVEDDGNGFELDTLRALRERMRSLREGQGMPPLALHGMGIMNIFLRLLTTYGEDMTFLIDSRPGEGASVTIGGAL